MGKPYKVNLSKEAEKYLEGWIKKSPGYRATLRKFLHGLEDNPYPQGVIILEEGKYKIREEIFMIYYSVSGNQVLVTKAEEADDI